MPLAYILISVQPCLTTRDGGDGNVVPADVVPADVDKIPHTATIRPHRFQEKQSRVALVRPKHPCCPEMSQFLRLRGYVSFFTDRPYVRPSALPVYLATVPPAGLSGMLATITSCRTWASRARKSKPQKGGEVGAPHNGTNGQTPSVEVGPEPKGWLKNRRAETEQRHQHA